ncbi:MAG TPA: MFS transporter [Gaiellaceae bacterium]
MSPRREPTLVGFAALGSFWGAWAALLPATQQAVGASKGTLGLALLFVAVGSLPAMVLIAGPVIRRFGRLAVACAGAAFAAATVLPGLATTLPALAATLVLAGATSSVFDVGLNAQAASIERETGRRLMPLAHGLYSCGVLGGAVAAGVARGAGAGRETIMASLALLIAATAVLLARAGAPIHPGEGPPPKRRISLERALIAIGAVAAAAFVVESATESWSALYLSHQFASSPTVSALGPGVFAASMVLGRFVGQGAKRVSDRALLVGGTLTAATGCAVVAVSGTAALALVGFAVAGAGISLNAPVVFGVAGRRRFDPAGSVATVTTLGYLGVFLGPPLMGGLAQATSLPAGFAVLAVLAVAVAAMAARLRLLTTA